MITLLDFKDFVKSLKQVEVYSRCSIKLVEKYQGILPEVLINTWVEQGFQKFGEGFLWTVNPDEYSYLLKLFVPQFNTLDTQVLFRTGFGDFIFMHNNQIYSYSVVTSLLLKVGQKLETFIEFNLSRTSSLNDGYFFNTYKKVYKILGRISEDEMYAYIPALQMGGEMKIENLYKQNMKAYLMMIAKLTNEHA